MSEPRLRKIVAPKQVRVAEIERDLTICAPRLRIVDIFVSPEYAVLGSYEVEDELDVASPVSRIVKDEDGGERDARKVCALLSRVKASEEVVLARRY